MTILEKIERNARIEELEEALADALYAWSIASALVDGFSVVTPKDYREAQERIRRARLALPKAQEATQ